MTEPTFKAVSFIPEGEDSAFGKTVKKRVGEYFKKNKIARTGDYRIWIKIILLPLLYLVPFGFILTNSFSGSLLIVATNGNWFSWLWIEYYA